MCDAGWLRDAEARAPAVITAATIEDMLGVGHDSEHSMFSDPWLLILPNVVLEKLVP